VAFDEASASWRLETAGGEVLTARVVVTATGPLRRPSIPDIPGLARFQGKSFHSARWDHAYDLRGKRVAVVGTGATAIQIIPKIAPLVERLHVFQRTPAWVVPKLDRPFTEREKRLFEAVPALERLYRTSLYWLMEARGAGFVWKPGILHFLERLARRHIRAQIRDPELRRAVTPDYRMGCKRILISRHYPALARERGLITRRRGDRRGLRRLGTARAGGSTRSFGCGWRGGFRAHARLRPRGRGATETWKGGAEAYYGLAVSASTLPPARPELGSAARSSSWSRPNSITSCNASASSGGRPVLDVLPPPSVT
jgi:cation diffusion facilitator CzcD-associated flavoprotein CzcO